MEFGKIFVGTALAAALTVTTPAFADTKTLHMVVLDGVDASAMQAVASAYQAKHPDVKIELQSYPWAQYFQVTELRLRSKDPSLDLIYVDAPVVASYASRAFLAPIAADVSTLTPTSVEAGRYKGEQYALPVTNSAQVLFYNKALFKQGDVAPPAGLTAGETATQAQVDVLASQNRWTWERVAEAARKLTVRDNGRITTYGFTVEQQGELYQLQPLGESLGVDVIGSDGFTAKGYLDSPAWTKAATFWSDLYNKWNVSPKSVGYGEATQLFDNGKLAMFVGGTWNVPILAKGKTDFGVAPFPYFEGGKVLTPTGSWYVGVSAASPNQAAAVDFAKFLTVSDEGPRITFRVLNQLPASKPLLAEISASPSFNTFPQDVLRLGVYESLNTAKARPVTPAYGQLQDAFHTAFIDIANGLAIPEALAAAVRKFEAAAARAVR
jgi:ABC-type glycerol-3-phosphate transport system substrate-binding protein